MGFDPRAVSTRVEAAPGIPCERLLAHGPLQRVRSAPAGATHARDAPRSRPHDRAGVGAHGLDGDWPMRPERRPSCGRRDPGGSRPDRRCPGHPDHFAGRDRAPDREVPPPGGFSRRTSVGRSRMEPRVATRGSKSSWGWAQRAAPRRLSDARTGSTSPPAGQRLGAQSRSPLRNRRGVAAAALLGAPGDRFAVGTYPATPRTGGKRCSEAIVSAQAVNSSRPSPRRTISR